MIVMKVMIVMMAMILPSKVLVTQDSSIPYRYVLFMFMPF